MRGGVRPNGGGYDPNLKLKPGVGSLDASESTLGSS